MFIIGELINGMYKDIAKAIQAKDRRVIQEKALLQLNSGADALDVNCGPASRQPMEDIQWLVNAIQEVTDKPLCIDSSKFEVMESGLKVLKNKAIINSTTADEEKLNLFIPLAIKYDAKLICLTISKRGIPQNKDQRMELAVNILAHAQGMGFNTGNIMLDPIVMPVKVAQQQIKDILESLREFKIISDPAPKTVVGLSNVSQGTTERSIINRTFMVMAIACGLDAAILDPLDKELVDCAIASDLILNKQIYCDSFLDAYRKK